MVQRLDKRAELTALAKILVIICGVVMTCWLGYIFVHAWAINHPDPLIAAKIMRNWTMFILVIMAITPIVLNKFAKEEIFCPSVVVIIVTILAGMVLHAEECSVTHIPRNTWVYNNEDQSLRRYFPEEKYLWLNDKLLDDTGFFECQSEETQETSKSMLFVDSFGVINQWYMTVHYESTAEKDSCQRRFLTKIDNSPTMIADDFLVKQYYFQEFNNPSDVSQQEKFSAMVGKIISSRLKNSGYEFQSAEFSVKNATL